ncbi:MAG TPA: response regulator [Sphingomonas sp.]|jgi:CheY-like chemotaxis protein|nr:response regulator [Sphingomonas sp.]
MTVPRQILIVEDEPLIAMMLEDFLDVLDKQTAGVVDTVADALARIALGDLDAAILDVNLRGGEKSTAIAEALAARNIPFVFATGGGDDSVDERFRDRPRLQKPFTMDGVAKALDGLQVAQTM